MVTNNQKRILFVLGQFYPEGGIAVLRHLRYIRYLMSIEIELLVLAPDKIHIESEDLSLKKYIPPNINIIRYRHSNSFLKEDKISYLIPFFLRSRINAFLKSMPPDYDFWGWFFPGIRCAVKVMKEYSPSVIYSSSSPYGLHLLSFLISRLFHVPWVADFRDEWSENPFRSYIKMRAWLDRKLEEVTLRYADNIIVTTEAYKEQLINISPDIKEKVYVIPNSFFIDDFDKPMEFRNERFTITYVGSFYSHQQPSTIIKSLRSLCDSGNINENDILLRIYGVWDGKPDNLAPYVKVLGSVTHDKAIYAMRSSDVNYLIVAKERGRGNVPGKIWEYIASGRPIIAEVPVPGESFTVLNKLNYPSEIVDCADEVALGKAILKHFKIWKKERTYYSTLPLGIADHDSISMSKRLTEIIDSALNMHEYKKINPKR
jgi:glycosyltransferase involved in cell wall biosynthesis